MSDAAAQVGLPSVTPEEDHKVSEGRGRAFLGIPVVGWMLIFFGVPYFLLFLQSLWEPTAFGVSQNWNLQNYKLVFVGDSLSGNIYMPTLLRSLKVGAMVTICATLLAFPIAYLLAFKVANSRTRLMLYALVIVPLWASYLLRAYAWKVILGQNGLLGRFLTSSALRIVSSTTCSIRRPPSSSP